MKQIRWSIRKLESTLSRVEVYDYINVISSIPTEEVFDEQRNKIKAIYRKVEEDILVYDAFDR